MRGVTGDKALFQWISRASMLLLIAGIAVTVAFAWRRRREP